jgi:flagellar basal body-associated protein FliL
MTHDFNKPPHTSSSEETTQKKRITVYILVLVGIFFVALIIYMSADIKPNASDAPPGHPNPEMQSAAPNNTASGTAGDKAAATDSNTATASDH